MAGPPSKPISTFELKCVKFLTLNNLLLSCLLGTFLLYDRTCFYFNMILGTCTRGAKIVGPQIRTVSSLTCSIQKTLNQQWGPYCK
jgi:hypothetical protein